MEDTAPTFFSGWRPALSWIIVLGFFLQFIALPIFNIWLAMHGKSTFTGLDTGSLVILATSSIGFGGLRTYEKVNGVDTK